MVLPKNNYGMLHAGMASLMMTGAGVPFCFTAVFTQSCSNTWSLVLASQSASLLLELVSVPETSA